MASRESGLLVAELEKPEPSWNWQDDRQNDANLITKRPFAISRKWVADFKLYHEQVTTVFPDIFRGSLDMFLDI